MNLWLRLLRLLASTLWRPVLAAPFGVSRLKFRVWPHDLDVSAHMNNGRYWTLMDLGRTDLMLRTGLWRTVLKQGWVPVVNTGLIRFRRELRAFQSFRLETRILSWTETHFVIEHRMLTGDNDMVAAISLVRVGLYDRKRKAFVPATELLALTGASEVSPQPTPEIAAFLAAEDTLKSQMARA